MHSRQKISLRILALGLGLIFVALALLWLSGRKPEKPAPATNAIAAPATTPAPPAIASAPSEPAKPANDGLPPVIPIPLAGVLSATENAPWLTNTNWLSLPRGARVLGGIAYQIDGLIQLQGLALDQRGECFRPEVNLALPASALDSSGSLVSPPGSNIASIHLLAGSTWSIGAERPGHTVAEVVWRYTDGTVRSTPIAHEVHVRDWWRPRDEAPARLPYSGSRVAWRGPNLLQPEYTLRLYKITLPNPDPARVIQEIDFKSAKAVPSFFVCALTLDPLMLGLRPENGPDLEENVDPPLLGRIQVTVQDLAGSPVAGARLLSEFWERGQDGGFGQFEATTDSRGQASLHYGDHNLHELRIHASHSDYARRQMGWDVRAGDSVPAACLFKLARGASIGGWVVDTANNPVPGASIDVSRSPSSSNPLESFGEQSEFELESCRTDDRGAWQIKGLPEELIHGLGLQVTHPDHLTTNIVSDSAADQQLRNGTFKIVLYSGIAVNGWVLDELDRPIAGASVIADETSPRQQTQTDSSGRFHFIKVYGSQIPFTALAKGYRSDTRTFAVSNGMADVVLKLAAGRVIRARVQNGSGDPLPDTYVELQGTQLGPLARSEFSTRTDTEGRFEWDSAPEDGADFNFRKTGYEQKRFAFLKPDTDNVVTLRKQRQVQGQVLDADTGQPVSRFSAAAGESFGADQFNAPGLRDFDDPNGRFTLELTDEENTAVKVQAEDYAAEVQKIPDAPDGIATMEIRLKPSATLRATVVQPDGTPVPGATVAFPPKTQSPGIAIRHSTLLGNDQVKVTFTDANGQFKLSSPPTDGLVAAAAGSGFGLQPVSEVRTTGKLVLQPFGRIEGTFKIAGKPVSGTGFHFKLTNIGIRTDFDDYRASTDEDGKFTIEKIPPGEGQVVRLVQTEQNGWWESHGTPVSIASGATTRVDLGDAGAVLVGHVSYQTAPTNNERLTLSGHIDTPAPSRPDSFASPEAARAFYSSPEWQAQTKLMKHFAFLVKADGSFLVDSIPPGVYSLSVSATKPGLQPWNGTPVAQGTMSVTVPDTADPYAPIQLGEIILKPVAPMVPRVVTH
ncbi:MAG: carboxypeptidase regulatory-like domain-containing protein [Verrucomicrobiota bacterium]